MTEKKDKTQNVFRDGEALANANKTQLESGVIEFDDIGEGQVLTVPLEGVSRKGKPYRVFHRLHVPDNNQLRKYNNRLVKFEQDVRGRRRKKGQQTIAFRQDTDGACDWLWSELIEEVFGYPGGKASVPIDHRHRAIEAILPDPGGSAEDDESE